MKGVLEQILAQSRSLICKVASQTADNCYRNLIRQAVFFNRLGHVSALDRSGGYTIIADRRVTFTSDISTCSFPFAFECAFF